MRAFVKLGAGNILKYGQFCLIFSNEIVKHEWDYCNITAPSPCECFVLVRQVVTLQYYAVILLWLRFFSCFQFSITTTGRKYLVRGPNTWIMPCPLHYS